MRTPRLVAASAFIFCAVATTGAAFADSGRHANATDSTARAQQSELQQLARLPNPADTIADLNLDRIRAGTQLVPRAQIADLPGQLTRIKGVTERKTLFIKTLLPAALKANAEVERQRAFVRAVHRLDISRQEMPAPMLGRLEYLEKTYGVAPGEFDELLRKVDRIPVSLLLAQAAMETGWGTSRFAQQGNALFGQHTSNPAHDGMVPRGLDDPNFRVRAFDSVDAAVSAYLQNLNSHAAYAKLRAIRAAARDEGRPVRGVDLAGGLEDYSVRGQAYVEDIRQIIRANDLADFRYARLSPALQNFASLENGQNRMNVLP